MEHKGERPAAVFAAAMGSVALFALTAPLTRAITGDIDPLLLGMRPAAAALVAIPLIVGLRLHGPRNRHEWTLLALSASSSFVAFPLLFRSDYGSMVRATGTSGRCSRCRRPAASSPFRCSSDLTTAPWSAQPARVDAARAVGVQQLRRLSAALHPGSGAHLGNAWRAHPGGDADLHRLGGGDRRAPSARRLLVAGRGAGVSRRGHPVRVPRRRRA